MVDGLTSQRDCTKSFFDSSATEAAIEEISSADNLTIFAGAGISADQEIPGWAELVRILLTERLPPAVQQWRVLDPTSGKQVDLAGSVINAYFQLPMASAVDEFFERETPGGGRLARDAAIRRQIYGTGTLVRHFTQKPSLAHDLLNMAITLKACGKSVHILTTNYDSVLEEIAESDPDIRNLTSYYGVEFVCYARQKPNIAKEAAEIPIVHIHGYIPRKEPDESATSKVVFSEPDYVSWMDDADMRNYIYSRFDHGYTLMIGASLRDNNIIAYLGQTDSMGAHRYALLPFQGDPERKLVAKNAESASVIAAIREMRGKQLGIRILTPDFYGQVRQFLIEVSLGASSASGKYRQEATYQQRVSRWVERFMATKYYSDEERASATESLRSLAREVNSMIAESKHAKAELWVRRDLATRTLELWCESQSTWMRARDEDYWPHTRQITSDLDTPAVISFANRSANQGQVTYRVDGRWTHFISAPIILSEEPDSEIPVGIVVLVFNAPTVAGQDEMPGAKPSINMIVSKMSEVGNQLLKC
jgi:SIR2-like domain